MPELPEVESICQSLKPAVEGAAIQQVLCLTPGILLDRRAGALADPTSTLLGKTIRSVKRRGKYIVFLLSDGLVLLAHMRMTGKFLLEPVAGPAEPVARPPHTHLVFRLENGPETYRLLFVDVRRFGRLELYRETEIATRAGGFSTLGPEPLGAAFTADYLWAAVKRHPGSPIKSILLNQQVVAGLGNIYVDESLFQAGVHPLRLGKSLRRWELARLVRTIRHILTFAVEVRGTSFSDYVDAAGRRGGFQPYLCVYGRAGQPCRRCQTQLEKLKIGGRGTVFCPVCQPRRARSQATAPAPAVYRIGHPPAFFSKKRE